MILNRRGDCNTFWSFRLCAWRWEEAGGVHLSMSLLFWLLFLAPLFVAVPLPYFLEKGC